MLPSRHDWKKYYQLRDVRDGKVCFLSHLLTRYLVNRWVVSVYLAHPVYRDCLASLVAYLVEVYRRIVHL